MKGKLALLLLSLMLLLPVCVGAEYAEWVCPECGETGNTGNYCPNCAAPRPVAAESPETQHPESPEVNDSLTQIPGETDRVEVDILRIDGSSFIAAKKDKYLYAPENAIDRDAATCWQFSAKKGLNGKAWLAMIIEGQTVDEVWIRNGFQAKTSQGKDQYPLYSRPKEIEICFTYAEDGKESDSMKCTLSDEITDDWQKLDVGRHENVYDVVISILSIYKAKKNPNTVCLSDLMLVQQAPAETAGEPWR